MGKYKALDVIACFSLHPNIIESGNYDEELDRILSDVSLSCDVASSMPLFSKVEQCCNGIDEDLRNLVYLFRGNRYNAQQFVNSCKGNAAKCIARAYKIAIQNGRAIAKERGHTKCLYDELSRLRLVSVAYNTFKKYV